MYALGDCIKLKKSFTLYREHSYNDDTDQWSFKQAFWADNGVYTIIGISKPNKRGMHVYYLWGATCHGWAVRLT